MDDINGEFPQCDVALVIGANDVTNPAARTDKASPIYGMPILDVDKAHTVMVIKRSMNPGFAGIDNDLYYMDKTLMLFGDAKAFVAEIQEFLRCVRDGSPMDTNFNTAVTMMGVVGAALDSAKTNSAADVNPRQHA